MATSLRGSIQKFLIMMIMSGLVLIMTNELPNVFRSPGQMVPAPQQHSTPDNSSLYDNHHLTSHTVSGQIIK